MVEVEGDRVWVLLDQRAELLGELEEAREAYKAWLVERPEYGAWKYRQAELKEELGVLDDAIEQARLHRDQGVLEGV